ncbi:MAG TPA: glutamine-hydrolyzing carbamoyl-phosphate synthase small subunit [Candidatus Saccharimonadales bacterium]|nr:glutamine-hydrolyzing carbamoyl-phosphate synthase small subunit [Candidatus Saccharimonadales bacterium]
MRKKAYLTLAGGQVFPGWGEVSQLAAGEVVFNTGMTGYVESLTDPSYAGQILVFTYPLIGNYGVQLEASESKKIQVSGAVVSESAPHFSHSRAELSLADWLASQNVPLLSGVDTRALTKYLRTRGTTPGAITSQPMTDVPGFSLQLFSANPPKVYNRQHSKKVILVDCGAKANILRSLLTLPVQVKLVPYDYDYTTEPYDAVLISNGPGDPVDYKKTIAVTAKALKRGKPVFGICLGNQIMALAAEAKTYKLLFGHRGHNQPCQETASGKCFITSQNHGYAITEKSLPADWQITFRNLNDGSVEGIAHKTKPFFSVQFHPEACPGPTDTAWLFKKFYQLI